MASIRDFAITTEAVATASMVCTMPTHVSGDLLIAFVNKDTNTAFTTPSGWTAQQTQTSAGAAGGIYTKRAASASETVTFALTIETCCAVVVAVQDCNGSTEADAISTSTKSGADDSTLPLAGIAITPGHNNCLVFQCLSTDSGGGFNALPPWVNLFAGDAGANSLAVAYTQQKTAAAITAADFFGGVADDSRAFAIAIRDDGNGDTFDGYIPLATTPARQITPMNGSTGVVDKGTWASAAANVITSVDGKTVTGIAIATTADSGINPYRGTARAAGAASKTNYSSVEINLTATDDITNLNGLIFFTFQNLTASDYKDQGTAAQGGKYIVFGSTSVNWRAWKIGGFRSKTEIPIGLNNVLLEYSTTDTDLETVGTPNFAALDLIQFGAMGYAAACSMLINEIYVLNVVQLAGGSTSAPLDLEDLVYVVNNGCGILPLIVRSGVQATLWAPLKFGGTDAVFFVEDKKTFAFPEKADGSTLLDFHVSNNKIGIEFDGQDRGSGDVDKLHFTDCLFTSPSPYYWRFASTHDAGASINFAGSSVINATVTLRSTSDISNMKFISCGTFTQNGATLTGIDFTNTKVTATAPADVTLISSCTFTKNTGTNYAIEVGGTAATITLTDVDFSGYAASNGSTGNEAIFVNIASGNMTINIVGGSVPSIRTAGCVVTVVNAVTVKVTAKAATDSALLEDARVLLYAAAGGDLPGADSVTISRVSTTASVAHTGHGMVSGTKVLIAGANQGEYNGVKTISNVSTDAYDFTVAGSPTTPATGAITSSYVILDGLTDVSGIEQDTAFSYTNSQPVLGRVRRGTSSPLYKTAPISGSITAAGLDTTVFLVADE